MIWVCRSRWSNCNNTWWVCCSKSTWRMFAFDPFWDISTSPLMRIPVDSDRIGSHSACRFLPAARKSSPRRKTSRRRAPFVGSTSRHRCDSEGFRSVRQAKIVTFRWFGASQWYLDYSRLFSLLIVTKYSDRLQESSSDRQKMSMFGSIDWFKGKIQENPIFHGKIHGFL